jgi:hypothetical protein
MNCANCGKEIEQADWFGLWTHVTSKLYGCGPGAQYGGKMAEPTRPETEDVVAATKLEKASQ